MKSLLSQINLTEQEQKKLIGEVFQSGIQFNFFKIDELSIDLHEGLLDFGEPELVSLTLHKKGVLFTFQAVEAIASLAVPFHQISVYKTDFFSFYIGEEFIKLEINSKTKSLVQNLLERKGAVEGGDYYGEIG